MQAAALLIEDVVVPVGRENPLETLPGTVAVAFGQPDQTDDGYAGHSKFDPNHPLQKFVFRNGPRDILRHQGHLGSVKRIRSGGNDSKGLSGFRSLTEKQKEEGILVARQLPLLECLTNLLLVFLVRLVA